jgi:hypothetical protein
MRKQATIKVCTVCCKELKPEATKSTYSTMEAIYYFHPNCFNGLCDSGGKPSVFKIAKAVMDFARRGFQPEIILNGSQKNSEDRIELFGKRN